METKADFWANGEFVISTDKLYLDEELIWHFLSRESYWPKGIPQELVKKSIANSPLCFGLYVRNPQAGESTQRAQVASRQQSCRIAL
ncbi:hypothetical protein [Effusibacillus pohliae]|uniref:hypothetical protein n=1 Tax=Effusibacillus pohliae TaxID=232270 RepID=UPI000366013D|nr:hypothetical protein [Effusibacillus pohliae]